MSRRNGGTVSTSSHPSSARSFRECLRLPEPDGGYLRDRALGVQDLGVRKDVTCEDAVGDRSCELSAYRLAIDARQCHAA